MPRKKVLILAPYFRGNGNDGARGGWIDDFCARPDLEFFKAPYPDTPDSWHLRGALTPLREWFRHLGYVRRALNWNPDCIVTSFPQLALVAAVHLALTGRANTRLVAWNFNLGSLASPWKGRAAGRLLRRVNRFIVHARGEIGSYSAWLGIEPDRFRFVPLQRGRIAGVAPSPIPGPYLVSMGSANRDYAILLEAVLGTGIKAVIISKRAVLDALPDHPDLLKLSGLGMDECLSILGGAALNVVPIASTHTASGQITFINSMRLGIATIVTRCVGSIDYIQSGATGLLVPPGDAEALRGAIAALWSDVGLRERIGSAGRAHAEAHFSDEAAARALARTLDEVLA